MSYLITGTGISIPVEGKLGKELVIARARNLKKDFYDVKVYEKNEKGKLTLIYGSDSPKRKKRRRR